MDLNSANPDQVGPPAVSWHESLPVSAPEAYPADTAPPRYLEQYNTRVNQPARAILERHWALGWGEDEAEEPT